MRGLKKHFILVSLLLSLAIAAAVTVLFFTRYTWAAGAFRDSQAPVLDLRGEEITLSQILELKEQLPQCYLVWNIPLSGGTFPSGAESVSVSGLTAADIPLLEYFDSLKELNVSGSADYAALTDFRARHPECAVHFTVTIGTQEYDQGTTQLTLENPDLSQLYERLQYLPQLRSLVLTGDMGDGAELTALAQRYPLVQLRFQEAGLTIDTSARELDLGDRELTQQRLEMIVSVMPNLERVVMGASRLEPEALAQLGAKFPDVLFLQTVNIGGQEYSTDLTQLDISGTQITAPEVEALLPCFGQLERVIMCDCGVDDETMDEMNRRIEDIRFIWSVKIKGVSIRTDATWFYPYMDYNKMIVVEEDLYPLRYLTDLEAIDIGHMTYVTSCEWVRYMPNLKYLILAETAITDISPLAELKNLVFLEIFTTKITDYSPLLECTALEDLNLGNTYGDPEPISKMTWLKHLWWSGIQGTVGLPCSDAYRTLPEALPNTEMKFNLATPNAKNGWRQLDNYYAMRDLMGAYYLT